MRRALLLFSGMIARPSRCRAMLQAGAFLLIGIAGMSAPASAFAGENCAMMSGICRDSCGTAEQAEQGDFLDCGEKQDCCVAAPAPKPALCCVDTAHANQPGRSRCTAAQNGVCASGVASPLACSQLPLCR